MAQQKALRQHRSKWIATQMFNHLDLDDVERRMVIIPQNVSLRKRKWRRAFAFLAKLQGRVFTANVCQSALRRLIRMLPFQMNISPKHECLADFVAAQAGLLRKVAKQAKRMGLEAWFRF